MSLDFILIKSHGHPLSLEDIDMDLAFKEGLQVSGRAVLRWSRVEWQGWPCHHG